ncbi:MAG: hypothetical protein JEZ08_06290 [Clostridiales bacterium]|nr:hypothetical protein [Clostridiales bacterium]
MCRHKINIEKPVDGFVEKLVGDAGILFLSSEIYDYERQYFRRGYGRADFSKTLQVFENYLLKEGYDV